MKITWLGHSGFRIEIEQAVLLIDPWLTGNPMFPAERRAEAIAGVTHVFLTHGHGDHVGDAVSIAKEAGVPVAGIYDLATWLQATEGVEIIGFNKGGTVAAKGALVTMVNACHSSSATGPGGAVPVGSEAGFMIAGEGHVIYVSGDTDIMADMDWMGHLHKPDIGILSAGGHFTMDMGRAAYAARRYFNFWMVIPCHYRTFPLLAQDAEELKLGLPGVNVIEPEVLVAIEV
jgi:L-ascorbate metabolism protein UlaG (beta-lactamase superfamily)